MCVFLPQPCARALCFGHKPGRGMCAWLSDLKTGLPLPSPLRPRILASLMWQHLFTVSLCSTLVWYFQLVCCILLIMADIVTHFQLSSAIKSPRTGTSKNSCVNTESFLNEQWILTHRLVCFNPQISSKCFKAVKMSFSVLDLWFFFFFSRF